MSVPLPAAPETAPSLEWSFHPWRESPRSALRALLALVFCCAVVLWLGLPALQAALLCAAVALTMLPALAPIRCRLDEQGVTRWSGMVPERRPWSALQRAERTARGVWLSPFERRHRLDAWRALFLPLPRDPAEREALDERLRRHGL